MKKNRMMRAASALLVAVLMTTCTISGTFAKYVTEGSASDTARVAKWGVEIEVSKDTEGNAKSSYATEYKSHTTDEYASATVISSNENKIVAPGTASTDVGDDLIFTIKGKPEVASKITIAFDATSDIFYNTYYPIVFTLDVKDTDAELTGSEAWTKAAEGTLAQIEEFLEETYSTEGVFYADPNETLDAQYKLSWKWAFEQNADELDTHLGNIAAGIEEVPVDDEGKALASTTLAYSVTITVEQVD